MKKTSQADQIRHGYREHSVANQSFGWEFCQIIRNLGWEHTRNYVYLQWLKTDDKNKKAIAFKTIPISEFNTGNWRTVRNVEYQNEAFAIYYIIRGRKKLDKAMLRPEVPGKYRITF